MVQILDAATQQSLTDEIKNVESNTVELDKLRSETERITPLVAKYVIDAQEQSKIFEDTPEKRTLYANIELLRLDYNQLFINQRIESLTSKIKQYKKNTPVLTILHESPIYTCSESLYKQFDECRELLKIHPHPTSTLRRALTMIIFTFYVLTVCFAYIVLSPIRLLNPLLLSLGVPTHRLPCDCFQRWMSQGALFWANSTTLWEGVEYMNPTRSFLMLYAHQSTYDPFTIASCPLPMRLIGKPSLFLIPALGWLGYVWGHISIDRTNLASAKKSMDLGVKDLVEFKRSTAVAPEGTRSRIGRLIDFKKGAFHLALQAKMPILPVISYGAAQGWPADQWMIAPTQQVIRVLPPIIIEENETYSELKYRVHKTMLEAYGKPFGEVKRIHNDLWSFLQLPFGIFVLNTFWKCITSIF